MDFTGRSSRVEIFAAAEMSTLSQGASSKSNVPFIESSGACCAYTSCNIMQQHLHQWNKRGMYLTWQPRHAVWGELMLLDLGASN